MPRKSWDLHDPRFWDSVDTSGGRKACWPWTGSRGGNKATYGLVVRGRKRLLAHRVAYELGVGPIPPGLSVCHRCDNPLCQNPTHLRVGSHAENMAEMANRGRGKGKAPGGDEHYLRREPHRATRGEAHSRAKLTDAAVLDIRARWPAEKQKDLAAEYGVSQMTISNVVRRAQWTHI